MTKIQYREKGLNLADLRYLTEPGEFVASASTEGQAWISRLPSALDRIAKRWQLEIESDRLLHGYNAVILPVRRDNEALVLKLTFPESRIADESRALKAWGGNGAVMLFESDEESGAMLLERLDASRTLRVLEPLEATTVAGKLLRRLSCKAPSGFRDLRSIASETSQSIPRRQERLGHPVPNDWFQEALMLSRHFEQNSNTGLLIHADFHYDNILAGSRESWIAIDPRPIAGEPEYALPELLWTRVDELQSDAEIRQVLAALLESGALNSEKARAWVVVRCVDYWLWGLENGLTDDPVRCERLLRAIA